MNIADMTIIFLYLTIMLSIGLYTSLKTKSGREFFLAEGQMGWIELGASLFASHVLLIHITSFSIKGFEGIAIFMLILFGWAFASVYRQSGVLTLPEFLGKKYGEFSRLFLGAISVISYFTIRICLALFVGALVVRNLLGIDFITSMLFMIIITGIYTISGGFKAIGRVDRFHALLIFAGAMILAWAGMKTLDNPQILTNSRLFASPVTTSWYQAAFSWYGIVLGAPVIAFWYFCTEQYAAQKILASRSVNAARSGAIFAGFLNILLLSVLLLPALVVNIIPGDHIFFNTMVFYANISITSLPAGLKGIVLISFLAVLISTLSNGFNNSAAIVTLDFYRHFRPRISEKKLILVGRLLSTLFFILAILSIPLISYLKSGFFYYFIAFQASLAAPVSAVFLFGIIFKRLNKQGAMISLITGTTIGILRFLIDILNRTGHPYPGSGIFLSIDLLSFTFLLFLLTGMIFYIVSSMTRLQLAHSHAGPVDSFVCRAASGVISIGRTILRYKMNFGFTALLLLIVVFLYSRIL